MRLLVRHPEWIFAYWDVGHPASEEPIVREFEARDNVFLEIDYGVHR